jgi:hypothetical protein
MVEPTTQMGRTGQAAAGSLTKRLPSSAEADGNRTRLSRVAAHTGFEDRGAHQDPDTSSRHSRQLSGRICGTDAIPTATAADRSRLLIQ